MNEDIIKQIAEELSVKNTQIESVLKLLEDGNTIPFIARYRKEATGGLSDETLRSLDERLTYLRNLEGRKEEIIRLRVSEMENSKKQFWLKLLMIALDIYFFSFLPSIIFSVGYASGCYCYFLIIPRNYKWENGPVSSRHRVVIHWSYITFWNAA